MKKSMKGIIVLTVLLAVGCTANQVASFDRIITNIETVVSQATTDVQAACNAAGPVEATVNTIAGVPATAPSTGYTAAQQNVLNAEGVVSNICDNAGTTSAQVINGLNAVEAAAQSLIKSEGLSPDRLADAQLKLDRLFGVVHRGMSLRASRGHKA